MPISLSEGMATSKNSKIGDPCEKLKWAQFERELEVGPPDFFIDNVGNEQDVINFMNEINEKICMDVFYYESMNPEKISEQDLKKVRRIASFDADDFVNQYYDYWRVKRRELMSKEVQDQIGDTWKMVQMLDDKIVTLDALLISISQAKELLCLLGISQERGTLDFGSVTVTPTDSPNIFLISAPVQQTPDGKPIKTGPNGGRYYENDSGAKVYVNDDGTDKTAVRVSREQKRAAKIAIELSNSDAPKKTKKRLSERTAKDMAMAEFKSSENGVVCRIMDRVVEVDKDSMPQTTDDAVKLVNETTGVGLKEEHIGKMKDMLSRTGMPEDEVEGRIKGILKAVSEGDKKMLKTVAKATGLNKESIKLSAENIVKLVDMAGGIEPEDEENSEEKGFVRRNFEKVKKVAGAVKGFAGFVDSYLHISDLFSKITGTIKRNPGQALLLGGMLFNYALPGVGAGLFSIFASRDESLDPGARFNVT